MVLVFGLKSLDLLDRLDRDLNHVLCGLFCRKALEEEASGALIIPEANMRVAFGSFPLLRNVSLQIQPVDGQVRCDVLEEMIGRLRSRLDELALLPSAGGACLLLVGVVLLALPLCMMSRHVGVIVEMVTWLLFA